MNTGKFLRYFATVSVGFTCDIFLFFLLIESGAQLFFSYLLSFCVGVSINVLLLRRYVFSSSRFALKADIAFSVACNGLVLLIGFLAIWAQTVCLGLNVYISKASTNALTFLINYLVRVLFFQKMR